ncbi:MAG TPA: helix-turn-helix domain-containing protein [Cellulomonadaceae bacterium]|nr:helix-turn-helix domain-containing protein [Cellulomonadaceae bacterium]
MTSDAPVFALPFISGDLDDAARMTGLSVREIQKAVRDGDLVPTYRGRKPLFLATELYEWVRSMPQEPTRARRTA